jgi:hypothetical protein
MNYFPQIAQTRRSLFNADRADFFDCVLLLVIGVLYDVKICAISACNLRRVREICGKP